MRRPEELLFLSRLPRQLFQIEAMLGSGGQPWQRLLPRNLARLAPAAAAENIICAATKPQRQRARFAEQFRMSRRRHNPPGWHDCRVMAPPLISAIFTPGVADGLVQLCGRHVFRM